MPPSWVVLTSPQNDSFDGKLPNFFFKSGVSGMDWHLQHHHKRNLEKKNSCSANVSKGNYDALKSDVMYYVIHCEPLMNQYRNWGKIELLYLIIIKNESRTTIAVTEINTVTAAKKTVVISDENEWIDGCKSTKLLEKSKT